MRALPVLRTVDRPSCPISGDDGDLVFQGLRDNFGATGNLWSIRHCRHRACRHFWLDPAPEGDELARAYAAYPAHVESTPEPQAKGPLVRAYRAGLGALGILRRRRRLDTLFLPPGAGKRLLELGCGNGARLHRVQQLGYLVEGQDIATAAVEVAGRVTGAKIHGGPLEDLALPSDGYDVVAMNHVLEHVPDPRALLREVHRILRPGGMMVSVHPNASSWAVKVFGGHWNGFDPPRHLHGFTFRSMRRTLDGLGFERVSVRSSPLGAEWWSQGAVRWRAANQGRAPPSKLRLRVVGIGSQAAALAVWPIWPSSGDDMVLRAWKPAQSDNAD